MTLRTQHTPAVPWPASPTLEDLGDPEWLAAYEAAGGHVRPARSVRGVEQAGLVGPLVEPLSKPNPNFLRRIGQPIDLARAASVRPTPVADEGAGGTPEQIAPPPVSASEPAPASPGADEVVAAMQERTSAWLSVFCPTAASAMEGAQAAILRAESESAAHAATSLRRALSSVADYVEPPGEGTRLDHTGTPRGVRADQYKNRLHLYLGRKLNGEVRKLALIELELTDQRLKALIGAIGKAVHAESTREDIELLYLTCWSLVARIAACAELPA
ncbi:MAG TPA: hypothetical protein VKC63_04100 [Solirubrobacterales bacterium]|nr:hypothetical protein [Solirubrobacterales bacterium]